MVLNSLLDIFVFHYLLLILILILIFIFILIFILVLKMLDLFFGFNFGLLFACNFNFGILDFSPPLNGHLIDLANTFGNQNIGNLFMQNFVRGNIHERVELIVHVDQALLSHWPPKHTFWLEEASVSNFLCSTMHTRSVLNSSNFFMDWQSSYSSLLNISPISSSLIVKDRNIKIALLEFSNGIVNLLKGQCNFARE